MNDLQRAGVVAVRPYVGINEQSDHTKTSLSVDAHLKDARAWVAVRFQHADPDGLACFHVKSDADMPHDVAANLRDGLSSAVRLCFEIERLHGLRDYRDGEKGIRVNPFPCHYWKSDRLLLTIRLTKRITSSCSYLSYPPTTTFIRPFDRCV